MVFVNCLDISEVDQELYDKFYAVTSSERKQRADRYRCPEDVRRCILAEALLRFSLKEACGYSGEIITQYNRYGKPFLKDLENFAYNISHSGKWVVAAYVCHEGNACGNCHNNGVSSDCERDVHIGIDVEKIRETADYEKIANRFFSEREREYIFSAADEKEKSRRFTEVWTLKESYVKYLGTGLSRNLGSFSVDGRTGYIRDASGKVAKDVTARTYTLGEDYYLSVCGNDKDIVIRVIGAEELADW